MLHEIHWLNGTCATLSGENTLTAISNCTCEGYDQVYECRVTGSSSGVTVWRGSAFNCPATGNEIHFFHRRFDIDTTLTCNSGAIVGRAIRAENDTYISQLTVPVSAEMIGMNISCFQDSPGAAENLISSSRLTLTIGIGWLALHVTKKFYLVKYPILCRSFSTTERYLSYGSKR